MGPIICHKFQCHQIWVLLTRGKERSRKYLLEKYSENRAKADVFVWGFLILRKKEREKEKQEFFKIQCSIIPQLVPHIQQCSTCSSLKILLKA